MNTSLRSILNRVERRELQVDVALSLIDDIYSGDAFVADKQPEDAIGQAAAGPPPQLTTYGGMETKQTRSKEPLPLSDDQRAELGETVAELKEDLDELETEIEIEEWDDEVPEDDDLTSIMQDAGYEVVEGAEEVLRAIDSLSEEEEA